jgi:hypothetical protein
MGTRGSFPGVKRPGREADHSPLSSAEVKSAWSYTSTTPSRGAQLKHGDNFTFALYEGHESLAYEHELRFETILKRYGRSLF